MPTSPHLSPEISEGLGVGRRCRREPLLPRPGKAGLQVRMGHTDMPLGTNLPVPKVTLREATRKPADAQLNFKWPCLSHEFSCL